MKKETEVLAVVTAISSRILRLLNVVTITVEIEWHIHTNCHPRVGIINEISRSSRGKGREIISNIQIIDLTNVAHYLDHPAIEITRSMVGTATAQTPHITTLHLDEATRRIPRKQNPQRGRSPNVADDPRRRSFVTCTLQIRHPKMMRNTDVLYEVLGGRNDMVDVRDVTMM